MIGSRLGRLDSPTVEYGIMSQDSITIRVSHEADIGLEKLTLGLMSFASQYQRFIREKYPQAEDHESDLLVHSVTEGSIFVELFGALQPLFQGMDNYLIFRDFVHHFGIKFSALQVPGGRIDETSVKELKELSHIAELATAAGSSADLEALEYQSETKGRKSAAKLTFRPKEARTVLENAQDQIREISGGTSDRHDGVLMRLHQTNLDQPSADRSSGEKGIIEAISDHPRRLVYANDLSGQRIKGAWSEGQSPYELGFTVDVDVQTVNGKPRAYRITAVHDVFPLDETDD